MVASTHCLYCSSDFLQGLSFDTPRPSRLQVANAFDVTRAIRQIKGHSRGTNNFRDPGPASDIPRYSLEDR